MLANLSLREWDLLIPYARSTRLLAKLAIAIQDNGTSHSIPDQVSWHLNSADLLAKSRQHRAKWEIDRIVYDLADPGIPLVLLKGSAYLMLGLPVTHGRLYNDVDILVPEERLPEVEATLRSSGWQFDEISPHQERYCRRWLHELPAMNHPERGTKLDVHHNIVPRIHSRKIDPELLFKKAQPVPGNDRLLTLSPTDIVLHSVIHLFRNGKYRNGLRDLVDLDGLLRHYAQDTDFWTSLIERARELNVTISLFFACRYLRLFLETRIPDEVMDIVRQWQVPWPPLVVMDKLVKLAMLPPCVYECNSARKRAHWLLARYPLCLWKKTIIPKIERLMGV